MLNKHEIFEKNSILLTVGIPGDLEAERSGQATGKVDLRIVGGNGDRGCGRVDQICDD